MEKLNGEIEIGNGDVFMWVRGIGDNEVHGLVRRSSGGFVPGTSGWYRTTDPVKAALVAKDIVSKITG